MITHISKDNFDAEVLRNGTPVLVDFWAERCQPCRMLAPILEELALELEGKIKVAKLDVDDENNIETAMRYRIQSIPTLIVFENGEPVKMTVGFKPKDRLIQWIEGN